MLRTPAVLGFSMAPRKSRRFLVAVTYAVMLALVAAIAAILPPRMFWLCILPFAYNVISRAVFGKLVKDTVLPEIHGGELTSLGLKSRRQRREEPDEREVAVRNSAYFKAYRVLAVYSIALWVAWPFCFSLAASAAIRALLMLIVPILAMALTLPQAIVLWSEPDVPE